MKARILVRVICCMALLLGWFVPAQAAEAPYLELPDYCLPQREVPITVTSYGTKQARLRIWRLEGKGQPRLVLQRLLHKKQLDYGGPIYVPLTTVGLYKVEARNGKLARTALIRITELGLVTKRAPRELLVYAVNLKTGLPCPQVRVHLFDNPRTRGKSQPQIDRSLLTGKDGMAFFANTPPAGELTVSTTWRGSYARIDAPLMVGAPSQIKVLFYTERPVYRPGQTVSFKGIVRHDLSAKGMRAGEQPGAIYAPLRNQDVQLDIIDAANNKLQTLHRRTNEMGSFAGTVTLPDQAAIGFYSVTMTVTPPGTKQAEEVYSRFNVQAYRKPEYEVTATPLLDPARPWAVQGEEFDVRVSARYYFGGAVKGARLVYSGAASGEVKLDEKGEAIVHVPNPRNETGHNSYDYTNSETTLNLRFQVIDESNRVVEASVSVAAPRADVVPAFSADRYVYSLGDTAKFAIETHDPLGRPTGARARLRVFYARYKGKNQYVDTAFFDQAVRTDKHGLAQVPVRLTHTGYLRAEVTTTDARGREADYVNYEWVTGPGEPDYYGYEFPNLKIILDKAAYAPGEKVRALVTVANPGSTALITLEGDRIFMRRIVKITSQATPVEFVYPAAAAPGAHLHVGFPHESEWVSDSVYVKAPDPARKLKIEVKPSKPQYRPGETARYTVKATDGKGRPARAEVSLGFVDKAIYGIATDETPDPFEFFYGAQPMRTATNWLMPTEVAGGSYQRFSKPVPIRQNFKDTAYWNPFVLTNGEGEATLQFKLPDNLTTWRATARAITSDTKAGVTTQETLVTKPLLVRLELPRFYVQDDCTQALVIVHNNSRQRQNVRVSLRGENAQLTPVERETEGAQLGSVEAGQTATFRWTVCIPQMPKSKQAVFTATARGDAGSFEDSTDAMRLTLPVLPHAVEERITEAGTLNAQNPSADFTLKLPRPLAENVAPSRLEINFSPSLAGPILQALPHLVGFPYGCVEQTMSQFLPTVVAARVLTKLGYPLPPEMRAVPQQVQAGIDKLSGYQHADGGWGWWKEDNTDPYMTAYVLYGLGLTMEAGYPVDRELILRGLRSVHEQFRRTEQARAVNDAFGRPIPRVIDADTRVWMVLGYATAMTAAKITPEEVGIKDDLIKEVFETRGKITNYSLAALAVAVARSNHKKEAAILADMLENRAKQKMTPPPTEQQWEGLMGNWQPRLIETWFDSNIEATALATQALVLVKPQSPLIEPALRWLLNQREGDIWKSTKDSAQVLITFADELAQSRELEPDETVRVSVNGELRKTIHFTAKDIGLPSQSVVMDGLAEDAHITLEHEGKGKLNYTALLRAYSGSKLNQPEENGLSIERHYALRDDKGVWREVTGPIPNGQLVRVELRVKTNGNHEYALIEDPLPTGFEASEADDEEAWKGAGNGRDELPRGWYHLDYTRRETRDDHIALFCSYLWGSAQQPGQFVARYIIRPESIGKRTALPARIELMYHPDVNARSAQNQLEVK